jgi:phage repressor protein C with HTH and peptisase S24 domain
MKISTFGERLREARKDAKLTQKKLAEKAGIQQATISELENDHYQGSSFAINLAGALGVSAEWLALGRGPKHISANTENSKNYEKSGMMGRSEETAVPEEDVGLPSPTEDEFAYVPQLDIAAACGNGRFEDHVVVKGGLAFKKSFLRDKGVPEHAARIIYASGGSMSPTLQDGCVVLLNLSDTEPRDGKVYAICKPDDGLVLKRLIWDFHPAMGRHTWILRSDNPDKIAHPDKVLPPDDRTMIAGRAVWNDNQL